MDPLRKNTEKSHIKLYWALWVISIFLLVIFLWTNVTGKQFGGLFFGYILLVCMPLNIIFLFKQVDLFNYLQTHHKKEWEKHFGTKLSIYTFSRSKKKQIYFSKEDFGDPILNHKRKEYKRFYIFFNTVTIGFVLIFFTMMVVFPVK